MDDNNLKVFIICTHSVAGALPLGIIITSDETTETLVKAFSMYKSILPDGAFFGKGDEGPAVFMTDNCSELRDALKVVWPSIILLLCLFHMLQQVWRWLCDSKNVINIHDRQNLMNSFKSLAYESDQDVFEMKYLDLVRDDDDNVIYAKYPQFVSYLRNVYELKTSWALCYRSELLLRGNNTNNNAEAQFLVMKDKILQRVKEYNAVALFEKLVTELTEHYKNKLLSIASGSYDIYTARRFDGKSKKKGEIGYKVPDRENLNLMAVGCSNVGLNLIRVPSESSPGVTYIVDTFLGTCECSVGSSGAPCKHQFVVWSTTKQSNPNFMPFFSKDERMRFGRMAIGDAALIDPSLYESLRKDADDQLLDPSFDPDVPIEIHTEMTDVNDVATSVPVQNPSSSNGSHLSREDAIHDLEDSFEILRRMIETSDRSCYEGISKFHKRLKKLSTNQIVSALHTFGSAQYLKKVNPAAKSAVKRAQKRLINVQPTAVQRRKNKNGSKKRVRSGGKSSKISSNIPVPCVNRKREHDLGKNIENNVLPAKKHSRDMKSRCKSVVKRASTTNKAKQENVAHAPAGERKKK